MGSDFENLILFGLLSLMLLIGTWLRARIKLFQDYLVPASIIGGLIGFALVSTGWLKFGDWQITSKSFNWFLFHAFNISYISLLLTRPRESNANVSRTVVRGGMWQTLTDPFARPGEALAECPEASLTGPPPSAPGEAAGIWAYVFLMRLPHRAPRRGSSGKASLFPTRARPSRSRARLRLFHVPAAF